MSASRRDKVSKAIKKWCSERGMVLVCAPRHVHPACYVVGYAAPFCLVVACPWTDSEQHLQDFDRANPLKTVHIFDTSLKAGGWCSVAYVMTSGVGELVAIPVVC